jgi:hypothetical protein
MKVNWNELPVDRDPATVEYDDWYADYRNTSVGSKTGSWGSALGVVNIMTLMKFVNKM